MCYPLLACSSRLADLPFRYAPVRKAFAVPVISEAVFASGKSAPGFGIWRNRLDRFDSGRSVCRAGYPRNKKADCGSVVPQSAFVNPCDICCTISLPRNRRRSHYCRRPPAIVLRRLPFRLLPLRIGPLRSDPAGRFAGRYTYPAKPLAMHC